MVYFMADFFIALAFIIAIGYILAYCFGLGWFERIIVPATGGIVFVLCFWVSYMIARFVQ